MAVIKALFWNKEQARLRAGFRILIQLTLFFIAMKSMAALLGIPSEITSNLPLWVFLAVAGVRLFRVLISVWLSGRFLDRRSFIDFGLILNKQWWQDLGFGLGLGILLMSGVFLVELAMGWVVISDTLHTANSDQPFILPFIVFMVLFGCVGFSEELNARGYHLLNMAEGFNFKGIGPKYAVGIAVFLSSLLFGVFHLGSPDATPISIFIIILMGFLLGLAYASTGRLAISIGVHISWNLFQGNVFGFPVSGTVFPAELVTFLSTIQRGPEIWTGGSFGPEGGLLGLFAVVMGILLVIGWVKLRYGTVKPDIQLAQYPGKNTRTKS